MPITAMAHDITQVITNNGSQFTSKLSEDLSALLGYKHLGVVPYRPQANGLAERRMKEVMKYLHALSVEKRIIENRSHYLPLSQRIINYSVDGSIGTQPARSTSDLRGHREL